MPDTPLSAIFGNAAFYPTGAIDAASALAHMVTRPDLVRIDADGEASEQAVIIVDGKQFDDWETVWIQWSWGDPFSVFRFTCAERETYPLAGLVLQFAPGQTVDIYLGGIQVINGVIITRQVAYDAAQHMVQLQGVSASWFANRSSIEHKTSDFNGKSFIQIADEILKPTGVGYETVGTLDGTPFDSGASPSPGQTIGQFLEYLARDRKIIVSNLPNGKFLFIGEHSWPSTGELVEGINIKKMQCVISVEAARSEFIVRAQKKANDQSYGRDASEQEARLKGLLSPYSILLTSIEHPVWSPGEVVQRANAEKMWNEDITKIDANVTVYGWFRPLPTSMASWAVQKLGPTTGHTLWQAGDEVVVNSPMAMLINETLKIRTVTWMQDSTNGTQTVLALTTPQGLNGMPVPRGKINTAPPVTPPAPPAEKPAPPAPPTPAPPLAPEPVPLPPGAAEGMPQP
jgi:prophage tail gpP-like protein